MHPPVAMAMAHILTRTWWLESIPAKEFLELQSTGGVSSRIKSAISIPPPGSLKKAQHTGH